MTKPSFLEDLPSILENLGIKWREESFCFRALSLYYFIITAFNVNGPMYVQQLPSVIVSMERDSINWAKGRGLSKKSYFPTSVSKPECHAASLRLGIKVGLRNHEEVSQDHFRPFHNWSFWESNRRSLTSKVGQITISSPRRTHCMLWVCFFGWELEGTGADTGLPTKLHF